MNDKNATLTIAQANTTTDAGARSTLPVSALKVRTAVKAGILDACAAR